VNPGDLLLNNVTLSGGSDFGGLSNDGTLSIKNSIITGNAGRGVNNNFRAALTIENSTISANTGGGVNNYYGTLIIDKSTISGNTFNFGGGGLNNTAGTVTITNSTISDNTGVLVAAYLTRSDIMEAPAASPLLTAPSRAIVPIGGVVYITFSTASSIHSPGTLAVSSLL
jgi:hypothetical protein